MCSSYLRLIINMYTTQKLRVKWGDVCSRDLKCINGVEQGEVNSLQLCVYTVQITFILIGQTRLVFGNCVCTCATKHSNAFRTFLN